MAELMTAGEGSSSQLTRLTKVVKFVRLLRQVFFTEKNIHISHFYRIHGTGIFTYMNG